jgi:sugar phosphate isomerase/epimerase
MSIGKCGSINRRAFLAAAGAGAAVAGISRAPLCADEKEDPYRGFRMGIQSYSLRNYKLTEALEISKKLGLKYWETFPAHIKVGSVPAYIEEQKKLLADSDVELLAYGVVDFDANESKAREVFNFAKAMGIVSISANPQKDKATFDLLDKLVEEYQVNIAIHNHGPGALYDKIDDVVQMTKDRHKRVGACVDTGHYLRSREDPVEALERLGERVYGVHLKDVAGAKVFKIVGEGDLNVAGCLKVLKKLNYQYCLALEYEENPQNPVPDLEICLRNVRAAMQTLG